MGALPTKKLTRARRGRRLTSYQLKAVHPSICPQCRNVRLPHRVCLSCGYYHGRQVIQVEG